MKKESCRSLLDVKLDKSLKTRFKENRLSRRLFSRISFEQRRGHEPSMYHFIGGHDVKLKALKISLAM